MPRTPHVLIVIARFYDDIADQLVAGASAELDAQGATYEVIEVPGAFELPGVVRFAIESGRFDGYVALGCVIRGETSHYDHVCAECARGLNELAVHYQAPLGFGVVTTENREQAWERAATNRRNKGRDVAQACLRMVALKALLVSEEQP